MSSENSRAEVYFEMTGLLEGGFDFNSSAQQEKDC